MVKFNLHGNKPSLEFDPGRRETVTALGTGGTIYAIFQILGCGNSSNPILEQSVEEPVTSVRKTLYGHPNYNSANFKIGGAEYNVIFGGDALNPTNEFYNTQTSKGPTARLSIQQASFQDLSQGDYLVSPDGKVLSPDDLLDFTANRTKTVYGQIKTGHGIETITDNVRLLKFIPPETLKSLGITDYAIMMVRKIEGVVAEGTTLNTGIEDLKGTVNPDRYVESVNRLVNKNESRRRQQSVTIEFITKEAYRNC